ncbi:MAG: hypothetical protein AUJ57_11345 [Zetaproteobacteria bacterium CG1_02_53_45]|nr:MAG: hypothetical protein AUJ57_11345 [Zetaproteobacteria bacterium CG1_02_53_45]
MSQAEESDRISAARIYLNSGNPEQAIRTAERHLKSADTLPSERLGLLRLIADAEVMQATHKHFENIKPAVRAIETLNREFPNNPKAAEFRWQMAWLQWQSGNSKQAVISTREIIAKDQQPENLRRAWLLMTRIHLQQNNFAYARSDLLQYGLQVDHQSREQAIGMAWLAIVDQGESRLEVAYKSLQKVYQQWPDIITGEPLLFSAYIHILYAFDKPKQTFTQTEAFLDRYISTPEAASVRLIHADLLAARKETMPEAIKEYGILASSQAETAIGLKAFIRKLMLDVGDEQQREKLLPAMVALKKIADTNQLSLIEDEAMLALARLWSRIDEPSADKLNSPALQTYARAALSHDTRIAGAASEEGSHWLHKSLQEMLNREMWLKAVSIWQQYPQLRPDSLSSQDLRLGVAHAMRMLMLFAGAEELLNELYQDNGSNIRGQRAKMELAKLWMDRQDKDGVEKIMHWLNRNEFTIYRPEMLVTVARIQFTQKRYEAARQTIDTVNAGDIAAESRANYWQIKAEISEVLALWHGAATAWGEYRQSNDADALAGLKNQARSQFEAGEFADARKLYSAMDEASRDASWHYHMAICELKTGAIAQGTERLQKLATQSDAGTYGSLAKLALADQQANSLLGEKP